MNNHEEEDIQSEGLNLSRVDKLTLIQKFQKKLQKKNHEVDRDCIERQAQEVIDFQQSIFDLANRKEISYEKAYSQLIEYYSIVSPFLKKRSKISILAGIRENFSTEEVLGDSLVLA